jgi:DNA-binding transcriptional LysR family regulator
MEHNAVELRHLQSFVAVAEELHFGRAAERLSMAQSPLSRHIRELERELGARLFERSTRSVVLTNAGEVLLNEAREILARVERARWLVQQAEFGEVGQLHVGFIASAAYDIVPDLLVRYRAHYPNVEIVPHHMSVSEQIEALRARRLHLGIVRRPVAGDPLLFEPLHADHVILAVPRSHRFAERDRIPLEELRDEPFVFLRRQPWPGYYDMLIGACQRAGFSPRIVQETPDLVTLIGLVATGVGVAFAPASAHELSSGVVIARPLAAENLRVDYLLARHPEEDTPPLQRFLELIRAPNSLRVASPIAQSGSS